MVAVFSFFEHMVGVGLKVLYFVFYITVVSQKKKNLNQKRIKQIVVG